MNQAERAELLEQIEKWNDADEFARCIEAIEAIPERERDYLLTLKLILSMHVMFWLNQSIHE